MPERVSTMDGGISCEQGIATGAKLSDPAIYRVILHLFCHPRTTESGRLWLLEEADAAGQSTARAAVFGRKQASHELIQTVLRCCILLFMRHSSLPLRDRQLIQIVDAALADAERRGGKWIACRPGCTQCCIGVFPINQLDAARLRQGLKNLEASAPERGARLRQRARDAVSRLSRDFPGDPISGLLDESAEAERRFAEFANDEPCPALDPQTGLCELYESRPMTCRVFGPPVRSEDGMGVCELCFQGARDEEIAACEMNADPEDVESILVEELEKATGARGQTIVAFCLAS